MKSYSNSIPDDTKVKKRFYALYALLIIDIVINAVLLTNAFLPQALSTFCK